MLDNREMRQVYCDKLLEMAEKNANIVVFEADLMKGSGTERFFKAYPERSFDVGVAEANMVTVAAGMSTYGKIPFCTTFGPFATRRCYDQVFISVAYSQRNVKITGTDPGITAEINGGTHMPFEDMGIMRNIPTMVCVEPTDEAMLDSLMPQIAEHNGPVYIRLFRKKTEKIYELGEKFDLFKAKTIKKGKDCTIICSGIMVSKAIEAEKELQKEGLNVGILNVATWKPLDKQAILDCAKETGCIVTAENHSIINGLGSAVAELLCEEYPVPLKRVGVRDVFGEVGKVSFLEKKLQISKDDIIIAVKKSN